MVRTYLDTRRQNQFEVSVKHGTSRNIFFVFLSRKALKTNLHTCIVTIFARISLARVEKSDNIENEFDTCCSEFFSLREKKEVRRLNLQPGEAAMHVEGVCLACAASPVSRPTRKAVHAKIMGREPAVHAFRGSAFRAPTRLALHPFGSLAYSCDPSRDAGTGNLLNRIIAGDPRSVAQVL